MVPRDWLSLEGLRMRFGLLRFDRLDEIAACVVEDRDNNGARIGRWLGEYDSPFGESDMLSG
jgi:hypothetical protein